MEITRKENCGEEYPDSAFSKFSCCKYKNDEAVVVVVVVVVFFFGLNKT